MSQLAGRLIKTLSLLGFDSGANHRFLPYKTVLVRQLIFLLAISYGRVTTQALRKINTGVKDAQRMK
jgi:hypothetical protein